MIHIWFWARTFQTVCAEVWAVFRSRAAWFPTKRSFLLSHSPSPAVVCRDQGETRGRPGGDQGETRGYGRG